MGESTNSPEKSRFSVLDKRSLLYFWPISAVGGHNVEVPPSESRCANSFSFLTAFLSFSEVDTSPQYGVDAH